MCHKTGEAFYDLIRDKILYRRVSNSVLETLHKTYLLNYKRYRNWLKKTQNGLSITFNRTTHYWNCSLK